MAYPKIEAQAKAVHAVLDAFSIPYEETTENNLKEDAMAWLPHSETKQFLMKVFANWKRANRRPFLKMIL